LDVAAADMNGDGRIDLVIVEGEENQEDSEVVIRLNPGGDVPWNQWKRDPLPKRGAYTRLAVGDIDDDGRMDVVAVGDFDPDPGLADPRKVKNGVRWWLSTGEYPHFTTGAMSLKTCPWECQEPCRVFDGESPVHLSSAALADVDGDGISTSPSPRTPTAIARRHCSASSSSTARSAPSRSPGTAAAARGRCGCASTTWMVTVASTWSRPSIAPM
jgi:hypothetical protein